MQMPEIDDLISIALATSSSSLDCWTGRTTCEHWDCVVNRSVTSKRETVAALPISEAVKEWAVSLSH
jgi:hypothetical protein